MKWVLVAICVLLLIGCQQKEFGAALGDTVTINYIGMFTNGSVFDTNVEAVASAAGLSRTTYEPLRVTMGTGAVIRGFENALIGMQPGDKKTVTLAPEDAYGTINPTKRLLVDMTLSVNRTIRLTREVTVSLDILPSGEVGETVETGQISYEVLSKNDETAQVKVLVEDGDQLILPNTLWNSTVVSVEDEHYFVRQDPTDGQEINTPFGPASISTEGDKLVRTMLIKEGGYLKTENGVGRVVSVNETKALIDFNHPMAGKTLIFDIELISIEEK